MVNRLFILLLLLLPSVGWADAPQAPQADDPEEPPRVKTGGDPRRPPTPTTALRPTGSIEGIRGNRERDPIEDLLIRSQKGVTVSTLLDELLDEVVHQLSKEDVKPLSPVAIRVVHLSSNLRPSMAQSVEARLVGRMAKIPGYEQVACVECRAIRSRVEGDEWVVTFGATQQGDLRRIGAEIGAKTFMDIDVTFAQAPAELTLSAKIYRASDGRIMWATAIKGDETTAAILRTGRVPPSREEQLAELKRKLEMRPYFGYLLFLGAMYISADGPQGGYFGGNIGVRLFERFGYQRRHMFGVQGEGMLDFASNHTLYSGIISGGYWFSILQPNLNRPDLRIGATVGGIISGGDGNSGILQLMVEYVLQFRLTANVAALYMIPTKYSGNGTEDLGGFGFAARIGFNW
jgi:hypothetical protein